jgi:hypothetical protein
MNRGNKELLRYPGTITLVALIIIATIAPSYSYPQQPFLQLSVDGPDLDNEYSIEESVRLGELDHLGTISPGGDLLAVQSRPLGSADFFSDDFKGVIYEFSPLTGGNNEFLHPNATLAVKIDSPANWQLSVSAYVEGDSTMGVDQLMIKEDNQKQYTPFTPSPQVISRGNQGTYYLFYDLALRIDRNDRPGKYLWRITYMIINY